MELQQDRIQHAFQIFKYVGIQTSHYTIARFLQPKCAFFIVGYLLGIAMCRAVDFEDQLFLVA